MSSRPHEHGLHDAGLGPVHRPPLHHGALLLAVLTSSYQGRPRLQFPQLQHWPHPSAGLLTALSLTLFVVNCETLKPRPQVSYQETAYLCWGSSALMLWAGVLSYLNHMGVRSKRSLSFEMQAMYRQWVVRQSSSRNEYARQSGANL
uniref:Uncharacterized protein n=1 Tax=Rousettus aegyptiacus TaxID=9407 RepID=A0A7J8CIG1_ROUAE|nr:hypothetical protein HJG63_009130 [Rousettus aegyptiacus]